MAVRYDGLLKKVRMRDFKWSSVPTAPSTTGTAGDMAYVDGFLYVCVATNTWERVAIATWTPPAGVSGSPYGLLLTLTQP